MFISRIYNRIQKNISFYKNPIKGIYRRFKFGEPISKHTDGSILYKRPVERIDENGIVYGVGTEKVLIDTNDNMIRQIITDKRESLDGKSSWIIRTDAKNIKKSNNLLIGDVQTSFYPLKNMINKGYKMFSNDSYKKCYYRFANKEWYKM